MIDQRATAEQSDKTAEQRRASHSAESVPAPTLLCKVSPSTATQEACSRPSVTAKKTLAARGCLLSSAAFLRLYSHRPAHNRVCWSRGLVLQAAGLTHIGYGPLKSENQDTILVREEAFTDRMGRHSVFGVFDGHGAWGKPIAHQSSQLLPYFVDVGLRHKPKVGAAALMRQGRP